MILFRSIFLSSLLTFVKADATDVRFAQVRNAEATLTAWLALTKDTLAVRAEVTQKSLPKGERLELSVHFPSAGAAAAGYLYAFAPGQPPTSENAPAFARQKVHSSVTSTQEGTRFDIQLPARALPPFPARGSITLELCASASPPSLTNCHQGVMDGGPLRLDESFRAALGLHPPSSVTALRGHPLGWVGLGRLQDAVWIRADAPLSPESLSKLASDAPVSIQEVQMAIPPRMEWRGIGTLFPVLTGKDPFTEKICNEGQTLKLWLYRVNGQQAERVLDWPLAKCTLGRATGIAVEGEDTLSIGYANGPIVSFIWSGDHFERTEIGRR